MTFQPANVTIRDAVSEIVLHLKGEGVPAATSMAGWSGGPIALFSRSGGQMDGIFDRVEMQIACYGDTRDEADDVSNEVRALMHRLRGDVDFVVQTRENFGGMWMPELGENVTVPKFLSEWSVTCRPLDTSSA